jgi:hypothetical protein
MVFGFYVLKAESVAKCFDRVVVRLSEKFAGPAKVFFSASSTMA